MSRVSPLGAAVLSAASLLLVTGCVAQKVYFDCGAKVDMVDAQGLVLSPGFPYNYSSGTHCVWQFVVPMDYELILEIFDFDVFNSHSSATPFPSLSNFDEQEADKEVTLTSSSLVAKQTLSETNDAMQQSNGDDSKNLEDIKIKPVFTQGQLTKKETSKVSNSAKRFTDVTVQSSPPLPSFLLLPGTVSPGNKVKNTTSTFQQMRGLEPTSDLSGNAKETTTGSHLSTSFTLSPSAIPETQQAVLDDCPHDVLYISDLTTFSSRFCGTNRPPSSQLVFGSSQEMVEVIMELITTTHWGRGFALLFHYHNLTESGVDRLVLAPTAPKVDTVLAAVSGAALLAMILTSALCIIFRPKLCRKRATSSSSASTEVPERVQKLRAGVSELQLVAENQVNVVTIAVQEIKENPGGDVSQAAEVDPSCSALAELDLGADQVFIGNPAPCLSGLSLPPRTARTSLPPDCSVGDNRRMFTDIHLETRIHSSSFCDSSIRDPCNALTQRCLNSTSNPSRTYSAEPGFGPPTGMPDAAKSTGILVGSGYPLEVAVVLSSHKSKIENSQAGSPPSEGDPITTVPVFGLSEKEDRQPLVSAEHLNQSSISAVLSGLVRMAHDGRKPAAVESTTTLSSKRVRPEWRLWGSQVSAGIGLFSSSESRDITGQPSSLTQSLV